MFRLKHTVTHAASRSHRPNFRDTKAAQLEGPNNDFQSAESNEFAVHGGVIGFGCGSKMGVQNGTLVNRKVDQNLRNPS